MKIIFIRHTSVDVEPGVCYGQTDVDVSSSFEAEADVVKQRLSDYNFDRVFSSPLKRCVRLAKFCGFDNPEIANELMEMNFGDWEMKCYDEIKDPRLQLWYDDFINVRATGGESANDQRDRFEKFLNSLTDKVGKQKTIAIFTHGGIMIHAKVILQGMTYKQAFATMPVYGEVMEINI